VGIPDRLILNDWQFDTLTGITTVHAVAIWGVSFYTSEKDVTALADWETTEPRIASFDSNKRLRPVAQGETRIVASYKGRSASAPVAAFVGEPPFLIMENGAQGFVYGGEATFDNGLPGVLVEIIAGHNAGRSSTSGALGKFTFEGSLLCGPQTLRGSKDGYQTTTITQLWCINEPQPKFVLKLAAPK
jgi:hypothetical protein